MTAKDIISFFTEKKFTVEGNTDKFVVKTENTKIVEYDKNKKHTPIVFYIPCYNHKTKNIESVIYTYYLNWFKCECQITLDCLNNFVNIIGVSNKQAEQQKNEKLDCG